MDNKARLRDIRRGLTVAAKLGFGEAFEAALQPFTALHNT